MKFERAHSLAEAIHARQTGATLLAGGTTVVDLLALGVLVPQRLVQVQGLGLDTVEHRPDGTTRLGALCHQTDVAYDEEVRRRAPAFGASLLSGASGQIRNMATLGGNLLQRTRCPYFRDAGSPCNKRRPGSGCPAQAAPQREFALFGRSESCIATFPSDLAVALSALDAEVVMQGAGGVRGIRADQFHRLPGSTPEIDHELEADEVIVAIELPALTRNRGSSYVKVRDRHSYAFALVSAAAAVELRDGVVESARVVLGNVAHQPWRCHETEEALLGQPATEASFTQAAELAIRDAFRSADTRGRVQLAKGAIEEALLLAAAAARSAA